MPQGKKRGFRGLLLERGGIGSHGVQPEEVQDGNGHLSAKLIVSRCFSSSNLSFEVQQCSQMIDQCSETSSCDHLVARLSSSLANFSARMALS